MQTSKELEKILDHLGLSGRERQVYLCLLSLGEAKLSQITSKSSLNKSTVHQVLKKLTGTGLVYADEKKYDKSYGLYPPARLLNLAANQRRKARRLELEIDESLPKLKALYRSSTTQPKVEIYNTQAGYAVLADKSLEVKQPIVYYLGNLDNLYKILGKEYDSEYYIPKRTQKQIAFKLLTYNTPLMREHRTKDKLENRETRFLPKDVQFEDTILIFDDTVIFLSSPEEKLALSITSPSIAKTQLTIFNKLWEIST